MFVVGTNHVRIELITKVFWKIVFSEIVKFNYIRKLKKKLFKIKEMLFYQVTVNSQITKSLFKTVCHFVPLYFEVSLHFTLKWKWCSLKFLWVQLALINWKIKEWTFHYCENRKVELVRKLTVVLPITLSMSFYRLCKYFFKNRVALMYQFWKLSCLSVRRPAIAFYHQKKIDLDL